MSGSYHHGGGGDEFEFDKDIDINIDMDVDLDWDIDVDVDKDVDINTSITALSPTIDGNIAEIVFEVEDFTGDLNFTAETTVTDGMSNSYVDVDTGLFDTDLTFDSNAYGCDTFTQIDISLLVVDDYVSAAGYMVAATD